MNPANNLMSLTILVAVAASLLVSHVHAQPNTACGGKMDLLFILDTSSNLSPTNFQSVLSYVSSFVDQFTIDPNHVQVAEVKFSNAGNYTDTIINFQDYRNNKAGLETRISQTVYVGRTANLANALMTAYSAIFQPTYGARNNVERVAVVITSGPATNDPNLSMYASTAAQAGILVVPVGITSQVSATQLQSISYNGNYIAVSDFSQLGATTSSQILAAINTGKCYGFTPSPTTTTSQATTTSPTTTTATTTTTTTTQTTTSAPTTTTMATTTTRTPVTTSTTVPTTTTTMSTTTPPTTTTMSTSKPTTTTTTASSSQMTTTDVAATTSSSSLHTQTTTEMMNSTNNCQQNSSTTTGSQLWSSQKLWGVYAPIWVLILVILCVLIVILVIIIIVLAYQLHQTTSMARVTGSYDVDRASNASTAISHKSSDPLANDDYNGV